MEHMQNDKTSSQILLEAANLLEEEGKWHKGSFFYSNDKGCSMCAHGAIAYCGNKEVRDKLLPAAAAHRQVRGDVVVDPDAAWHVAVAAARAGAGAAGASPRVLAGSRRAANPLITNLKEKHGETAVAHYKAFKVGLNYDFNDNPNTTKQDVIDKLREAALLP